MSCLSVPVAEDGQPEHGRGSYVYGYGFDELVASMPSMAGKTIAVTGSTSGTGYVLAREAADPLMTVHGDADANPYARPARGGGGCAVM